MDNNEDKKVNDYIKKQINEANVNVTLKQNLETFKIIVPTIVEELKFIYDELIKQNFNEEQAYDFAKSYIFKREFPK